MNLYEISSSLKRVLDYGMDVDIETGEVLFDSDSLDQLEMDYLEKLANTGLYIKNLESDIEAIKREEKSLAERRRVKENKAQRLKEYMLNSMNATETKKVEDPRIAISTRKSQRVIIDDMTKIPLEFIKITESVNKSEVKKALKSGDVAGAHIEENESLQLK